MLITPAAIRALHTTFTTIYQAAYDSAELWYPKVAMTVPSASRSNTYGWMAKIPAMRQWVGPRVLNDLSAHVYTLENLEWENTIAVDRSDWEDHNLGTYEPTLAMMGQAAAEWPQVQLVAALQANPIGFDGLTFFNANHPLDPAGVQSNTLNLGLTAPNYQTARATMMSYTGEDGRPLGVMPDTLIVPPQLERTALTLVNADMIPNDGGTAAQSNVLKGSARVIVAPELAAAPTRWYLADCRKPVKPLVWQLRRAPELVAKTQPTDDGVFFDRQFVWGTDARGNAGVSCWWLCLTSMP
jgi:phage major head subunit gpT-like protein